MVRILKKLGSKNLVNVYMPPGRGNLLNWGEFFSTRQGPRTDISQNNGYFIIGFKKTTVHIDSYVIQALKDGLFPKKWNIYVSNNNLTWERISSITTPLCNTENIYPVPNCGKDYCRISEENTYPTNYKGFNYFVKFEMLSNSFYGTSWQDDLCFTGFEIYGSFLYDHQYKCSCHNKKRIHLMVSLIISLLPT